MSVGSLCQVCESAQADHSCDQCGRLVCDRHFERSKGVCAVCAGSRVGDERGGPSTGPGPGADDAGPGTYR